MERFQEFLTEDREDMNARSIENSLTTKHRATKERREREDQKTKPTILVAETKGDSKGDKPKKGEEKGKGKGKPGKGKGKKGNTMTKEEKAKTPCVFHQMPSGCLHGDKREYLHESKK